MKGKGMKMITRRRDGGVPSEVGRFEVHGFDARIHSVRESRRSVNAQLL